MLQLNLKPICTGSKSRSRETKLILFKISY